MARPEFGPNDVDKNYQIESGVAQPLKRGDTTTIDKVAVEKVYRMLDEMDNEFDGSLDEKCGQIITKLHDDYGVDAEYEIGTDAIHFRPKPR